VWRVVKGIIACTLSNCGRAEKHGLTVEIALRPHDVLMAASLARQAGHTGLASYTFCHGVSAALLPFNFLSFYCRPCIAPAIAEDCYI